MKVHIILKKILTLKSDSYQMSNFKMYKITSLFRNVNRKTRK